MKNQHKPCQYWAKYADFFSKVCWFLEKSAQVWAKYADSEQSPALMDKQSMLIFGSKYASLDKVDWFRLKDGNPEQSMLFSNKVFSSWAKFADSGLRKPTQRKLGWLGANNAILFKEWRFRAKYINPEQSRLIRSKVCQSWAKYVDYEQSTAILSKVGWLGAKYGNLEQSRLIRSKQQSWAK